jgi:hypothetical protein
MKIKYVPVWEFMFQQLVGKSPKKPGEVRKVDLVPVEPGEKIMTGDILVYVSFGYEPDEVPGKTNLNFGYRGEFALMRAVDILSDWPGTVYGNAIVLLEKLNEKTIPQGTLAMIKQGATVLIKELEGHREKLPWPQKPYPPKAKFEETNLKKS